MLLKFMYYDFFFEVNVKIFILEISLRLFHPIPLLVTYLFDGFSDFLIARFFLAYPQPPVLKMCF